MNLRLPIVLLIVILAAGCQHVAPARSGEVTHVVLCWLKEPGNEAAVRQIIETSEEFRAIPGVLAITAGRPLPSTRPVVDSSFDVGLVMIFRDEQALHDYDQHPTHVRGVQQVLRPLTARIQVYDIKKQGRTPRASLRPD